MGSKKKLIHAAGAVVLRRSGDQVEVLAVHRPRYDDWSLPKGHQEPDEDLPVTAVREVAEETGHQVVLRASLGHRHYQVSKGTKKVWWWVGEVAQAGEFTPGDEVDQVAWVPVDKAAKTLSYADDIELVRQAVDTPQTSTVLLIRHAKAMLRKNWTGKDWKRPLSGRGRRQARQLVPLLGAFGIRRVNSSSSTRCLQTVEPFATRAGLPIIDLEEISEEAFESHPKRARRVFSELVNWCSRNPRTPTAICGHRPVLPMMREVMGLDDKSMLVAEVAICHYTGDGRLHSHEVLKSRF